MNYPMLFRKIRSAVTRRYGHGMGPSPLSAVALLSLFFLGAAPSTVYGATDQDMDRIVVIVNDDVITASELEEHIHDARLQLQMQKIKLPPEDLLRKQVLERAILERAQLQVATLMGIGASDADIDKAIDTIARRSQVKRSALLQQLAKQGVEQDRYREGLRKQIIIQKLVEANVQRRVSVSDSEVDEFLQQRDRQLGGSDAYQVSHIMIPVPETATSEAISQAKQRAQKLHTMLKQGADFQETASAYSKGRNALEGGNLGWKSAGQLPELFLTAVQSLAKGGVSDILRSPNGFHILKLNDKRSASKSKTVTQTHARHILMNSNEIRSDAQVKVKLLEIRERLEQGEDFIKLARAYSEDTVSAAKGGDLGWYNPGQMVPEFEKAAAGLQPKQISKPVQSPFGYHLIQVLGRRQKDIGKQLDRNEARRQIRARKTDERYQQWVRQIRDEAYVQFVGEATQP